MAVQTANGSRAGLRYGPEGSQRGLPVHDVLESYCTVRPESEQNRADVLKHNERLGSVRTCTVQPPCSVKHSHCRNKFTSVQADWTR